MNVPDQTPERLLNHDIAALEPVLIELALKSFAASHAGVLLLDTECNIILTADSLAKQMGYDPEELQTMNLQSLIHPSELLMAMHNLSQLLTGQLKSCEAEMRWLHKDGSVVWLNVQASGLNGSKPEPDYLFLQTQNITDRKQLQDAMTETLAQMTAVMETMTDAFVMLNRKSEFVYINRNAERLLGRSREELLNRSLHTVLPEWIKSGFYKQCQRALDESIPVGFPFYFQAANSWVNVNCFPSKQGIMLHLRDITKIKEQEEALHFTRQQLNSFIEHAADNICILDADLKLVQVNKAFMDTFGYAEKELLGKRPIHIPDHLWIESELVFRKVLQGKQISCFETKLRHKNGVMLDVSLTLSPVVGPDHEVRGVCVIGRDISERIKTEELLRNAEKLSIAGQLAAGVAHEIRNPLTALKGFTQFMKEGAQYNEKYLEIMLTELERIEHIIGELLLLARPQHTVFKDRPLASILTDVISLLESQANLNNIRVQTLIPDSLPNLHCEANQLKQVFINIIKNATEAVADGGQITVAAEQLNQLYVKITITDDGEGIPPDILKRLGQPFFTTKENGSGLGLMISQKIITEHNGRLEFESEYGKGTRATITLPISPDAST